MAKLNVEFCAPPRPKRRFNTDAPTIMMSPAKRKPPRNEKSRLDTKQ